MICGQAGPMGPVGYSESHGEVGGGEGDVYGMLSLLAAVVSGGADWYQSLMQILVTFQSVILGMLKRQYLQNDYFAGGLGLMLLGFIAASFKSYSSRFWMLLTKSRKTVSIHVKPEEPAYMWLKEWLCDTSSKSTNELELQARWDEVDYDDGSGYTAQRQRPRLLFVPKLLEPQHVLFKGQKITFQTEIGPVNLGNGGNGGELAQLLAGAGNRALVLTAPTRQVLEDLVQEAMEMSYLRVASNGKTCIKRWSSREAYWTVVATKMARPLKSVILDVDVDSLVKDAKHFLSSQKWYNERGVPHRRGYLLHGPPGTGKTSTVQVLAGELGLDVAMVGLSDREMSDESLQCALNRCDMHSILVLEDIDAAFSATREGGEDKRNSLSFSGLLNAIDGMTAQEGRIVVMTTNHIERLDPALIRPGRVDMRLFLGLASTRQISGLFRRFFPKTTSPLDTALDAADASDSSEPDADADAFAASLPDGKLSPAAVQGYLLLHRDNMPGALANSAELLSTIGEATAEDSLAKPAATTPLPASSCEGEGDSARDVLEAEEAFPGESGRCSKRRGGSGNDRLVPAGETESAEVAPGDDSVAADQTANSLTISIEQLIRKAWELMREPYPSNSLVLNITNPYKPADVAAGDGGVAADPRNNRLKELARMAEALQQHAALVKVEALLQGVKQMEAALQQEDPRSEQELTRDLKKMRAALKLQKPGPDRWHRLVVCAGGVVLGALALGHKR